MENISGPLRVLHQLYAFISNLDRKQSINASFISSSLKKMYIEFSSDTQEFKDNLEALVNMFSRCDHFFFLKVLSRVTSEEDHAILINSIGNFGQLLSIEFQDNANKYSVRQLNEFRIELVLFIIKGPFDLAHMSFAKSFLHGFKVDTNKTIKPYFMFLDDKVPDNIKSISFDATKRSAYQQLLILRKIIDQNCIGTIIWPSVSQNISLFLGSKFTIQQIYWSARYKNSLFDSVNKYFFGARSCKTKIQYNGVSWCYGRFFVAEWNQLEIITSKSNSITSSDQNWKNFIERKRSQKFLICATISSERKINNKNFRNMILTFIKSNPHVYYFYTSRSKNCALENLLVSHGLQSRFKRIKWIDRMSPILRLFDLILDSYPVGASHALCYALESNTPFVSMYNSENLRSSLLETMAQYIKSIQINLEDIGFAESESNYLMLASKLCNDKNTNIRHSLLEKQVEIIGHCLNNPNGMYQDFSDHILS